MTLSQLTYLLFLEEHGSFVAAARAAKVTQPTLSMQVAKLEQELGVLLFDRSSKPIQLTAIGRRIIAHAKKVHFEIDSIYKIISDEDGVLRGSLRLGILPTIAPYLLHRFLQAFTKQNPNIELDVRELQTEEILQLLYANEIDVGVLATPIDSRGLKAETLYYEPFYLYSSKGHPHNRQTSIDAASLKLSEMWTLQQGHCLGNQALSLCEDPKKNSREKAFLKSGSLETLLRLVEKGNGFTIVPALALEGLEERGAAVVRPFKAPTPSREISAIFPSTSHNRAAIKALSQCIRDALRDTNVNRESTKVKVIPISS